MDTTVQDHFLLLVNEHRRIIYAVCHQYCDQSDHEDLCQEILYQAWNSYPGFEGRCKFSTWLYRISKNVAITQFRRKKSYRKALQALREFTMDNPFYEITRYPQDTPGVCYRARLNSAVCGLTDDERALVLLYGQGMRYEQIAQTLRLDENLLRVRMHRAKVKLRRIDQQSKYN